MLNTDILNVSCPVLVGLSERASVFGVLGARLAEFRLETAVVVNDRHSLCARRKRCRNVSPA
jgi:hypothetical protein